MDYEDGKRCLWLVAAVSGRRAGVRRGSVYRLKMAVWALFCGPRGRPAARLGPSAGSRPFWGPVRRDPARPAPGDLGVPCRPKGLGEGRGPRAQRPPDSPRRMKIASTPPTSRSRANGRMRPSPPRLALAPRGSDPDRLFSKPSTPDTIFGDSFTVIVLSDLV